LLTGGSSAVAGDWFANEFIRARAALTNAAFDTILGFDFSETITTEIVDGIGAFSASPVDTGGSGGILEVVAGVGDAITNPSQVRMQPTGCGRHVQNLRSTFWYMSALARLEADDTYDFGNSAADALALWNDDDNRVTLGLLGNASGGSATNWCGRAELAAGNATTLGPLINPSSLGGRWTKFAMWNDPIGGLLHFAVNDTEFAGTLPSTDAPNSAGTIGPILQRTAVGGPVRMWWDKLALIVTSPSVGTT